MLYDLLQIIYDYMMSKYMIMNSENILNKSYIENRKNLF